MNGCDISTQDPNSIALRNYNDIFLWSVDRGCSDRGRGCQVSVEAALTQWEPCTVPTTDTIGEAVAFGNPGQLLTISEGNHVPILIFDL